MASTEIIKVKVQELSKYGFKANDRYVGLSKQLKEADKTRIVPGAEFDAEFYVADSGKEYLNKILSQSATAQVAATPLTITPVVDTERAKKFTPKPFVAKFQKKDDISTGLSKDEWAQKDRRISRQGCIQAAVHALGPVMAGDGLFEAAKTLADQMLAYVNEK